MARFIILFTALLLVTGSVINAQDLGDSFGDDKGNKTTTSTTSTTTTTEDTTTTPETTTTTTTTTTAPPETTTTPPETTTAPPETTTAPPETTTEPETTTTTTTAPPSTTPAPKPDSHIKYNVTENDVTCIMVAGEIFFNINYNLTDNSTATSKVFVPSLGVDVSGSCNSSDGNQFIKFSWGNNTVEMNFEPGDKDFWTFTTLTAALYLDEEYFANATDAGETLNLTVDYNFSPSEVGVNHSYICRSSLTTSNVTATMNDTEYQNPVTSTLKNIQLQAFNQIKNETDFVQSVHCSADNTSDVVPIAVGCALAGLVVIVLIAYLVGRRRRSGAYQSV